MISPYDKKRVDTLWEIISDLTQEQREYVMSKGIIGRDTQEKAWKINIYQLFFFAIMKDFFCISR